MVALMLTLDTARGGYPAPAAEPSFRAGWCEDWEIFFCRLILLAQSQINSPSASLFDHE